MLKDALLDFLKNGRDWETRRTSVPGVFVIKAPATRNSPARLLVQLNPLDEAGRPVKKRGLIIKSRAEIEQFRTLLQSERLPNLLRAVEEISGPSREEEDRTTGKGRAGTLEI